MSTPVQVFVRDANFNLLGQIEDFQQLTVNLAYNDVGTWELTMPAGSSGALLLDRVANPGGGVIIMRNGVQLLSGPARGHKWSRSGSTGDGVFTVVGLDDSWILAARLVWPDPIHTVDAQANVWWSTWTGNFGISQAAETIMYQVVQYNMMPGLARPERQVPNLIFGTNLARGKVWTYPKDWRFNTVLDGLQQMSVTSKPGTDPRQELGFTVDQVDLFTPQQKFQVFLSNDRSATVRFSFNVGNLAEAEYTTTAPKATTLITGAGQTTAADSSGVAINPNSGLLSWSRTDTYYPGFYAEGFLDASEVDPTDINSVDQLTQSVNDYWDSNGGQIAATFKALDTTGMAFGTHYQLGDFVTVELPQLTFVERVRGIGLAYSPDTGEELTLAVGSTDGSYGRLTPGAMSSAMLQRHQREKLQFLHRQHIAHLNHLKQQKRIAAKKAAHARHLKHLKHQAHLKHRNRVAPASKKAKR